MSIGLLLFFLFVLVANVAIGYMIAILLGIGPPDFRTAWLRIKLSVTSPLSYNGYGSSQVNGIAGFMTSFVSRFKKHAPPTSDEPELLSELPVATPTETPIPPAPSGNNPVDAEQPNLPP